MNYRQVGIGAVAATILVLGANANSLDGTLAPRAAMQDNASGERITSMVARLCGRVVPHATTFVALKVCGNGALDEALDVFGDVVARLKQL